MCGNVPNFYGMWHINDIQANEEYIDRLFSRIYASQQISIIENESAGKMKSWKRGVWA